MFCLGLSFGLYAVKYMGLAEKSDLTNYFTKFTQLLTEGSLSYTSLLLAALKKNLILIICLCVLGVLFFGGIPILIADFIKGFSLGYTFSFIVSAVESKGLLLALISILPQNLIYIPAVIILSMIGLSTSTEALKGKILKKNNGRNNIINEYVIKMLLVVLVMFLIGILVETFISPSLIKLAASKL